MFSNSKASLTAVLLVALSSLALAWSDAPDGEDGDPYLQGLCCQPAVAVGPADSCPAGECTPNQPTCSMLKVEGSWKDGKCSNTKPGTWCINTLTNNVKKPIVQCKPVACTLAGGGMGWQCGWSDTGQQGPNSQAVKSCNGGVHC